MVIDPFVRLVGLFPLCAALAVLSCGPSRSGGECSSTGDCPSGFECLDGTCVPTGADGDADGDSDGDADADGDADGDSDGDGGCASGVACGDLCCAVGERCVLGRCVLDLGECEDSHGCIDDTYCLDGVCVPYGLPEEHLRDESCELAIDIEAITPALQCSWQGPPPGDPWPASDQLQGTAMVVDFDFDDDPATLSPSIVFVSTGGGGNVLRVLHGGTCAQQHDVAEGILPAAALALGDLDGDGRPEIVACPSGGGLVAYTYDLAAGAFVELWRSAVCSGGSRTPDTATSQGVSIHDLDDDGVPELVANGVYSGPDGCRLAAAPATAGYGGPFGVAPVVADVDEDGEMELVSHLGVYRFDAAAGAVVAEPYYSATAPPGTFVFVAVGDLGNFPLDGFGGEDRAEIVLVGEGVVSVRTIEGTEVFSASLPSGRGGPPTIADFDGDGRAEVGTAAREEYVVFDLDCRVGGDVAGCGGVARTDGRLWAKATHELSSGVTGSSVFDFDADGSAEVVYHDECFLRIYDGATGTVLYSYPRYSFTWFENPVIADVDGDFHTEIVVGATDATSIACPATDPDYPSARSEPNHGVYVLRDELDRWAASRPVWNQHAYHITHVTDRGEIPRTSDVVANWREPGLNNFRQNVQGELSALGVPDLTAAGETEPFSIECTEDSRGTLVARICNRGMLPVGMDVAVSLRRGAVDGPELCRTTVGSTLPIGECREVSCEVELPESPVEVYVVPDPDGLLEECSETNNYGIIRGVYCQIIG